MNKITPSNCPNCDDLSQIATPVDNPTDMPQEGSICFCSNCGNINKLDKDLKLVEVTEEEMNAIKANNPVEYYEIFEFSKQITEAKKQEK